MSSSDDRDATTSRTLAIAIGVVAAALVFVVAVAVGLYLADGDDDPGVPTAAPGAPASQETSESRSPSPSSSETSESTSGSTTSSTRTSTSSSEPTTEPRDDLGTGRDDVDARGWIASRARCHDGAVADRHSSDDDACETPGGDKYYRGDAGDVGSLEAPIIVDEGDRIVARNGAWKYQMSPDGLMITENNEVRDTQAATAWGRA